MGQWAKLAERAVEALERIAKSLEVLAQDTEAAWRILRGTPDQERELSARGVNNGDSRR